jgi:ubiquinol-cytochrome c reductase iron-sulfur subunit
MSAAPGDTETDDFNVDDPALTRFDLVREGARRDGVEIVHYEPHFPVPGTLRERRTVRTIGLLFFLAAILGLGFVVAYIAWPWRYHEGLHADKLYTPVLGATMGLSLLFIGIGMITWGKKLLPEEIAVQERHDGGSSPAERKLTGQTMLNMVDELGVKRRPLLGLAALAGLLPLGAVLAAPWVGGLIKKPSHDNELLTTAWAPTKKVNGIPVPIALARDDGTLIQPADVSVGGQMTVFPSIFENGQFTGSSNAHADSPTLLIRLRDEDAATLRANLSHVPGNEGFPYGNYVAYSKICTHAGCPASLYEQQTNRLLCPCHQSQFNILDNAQPIFGPATRRLPMLAIAVDPTTGNFVAGKQQPDGTIIGQDYTVAIGPGFWERP